MKIYLDIFFLVNAEMDFVVLVLESMFLRRRIRWRRLLAASISGGVFSILILVLGLHRNLWFFLPVYFAGSSALVYIAFGKTTLSAWIKNVLFFYVAAAVLSGTLLQLQSAWNRPGSMVLILTGALAVLGITYKTLPCFENLRRRQSQQISVRVCYGGRRVQGCGFLDTGNHLREPFSNKPVAIANRHFLQPLWSKEEPVFRLIPFHAVGTKNGMMPVFYADCLELRPGKGDWGSAGRTWIAVCDNDISADGEFDLILHPDMTNKINLGG